MIGTEKLSTVSKIQVLVSDPRHKHDLLSQKIFLNNQSKKKKGVWSHGSSGRLLA
jgi:hypothetical protein